MIRPKPNGKDRTHNSNRRTRDFASRRFEPFETSRGRRSSRKQTDSHSTNSLRTHFESNFMSPTIDGTDMYRRTATGLHEDCVRRLWPVVEPKEPSFEPNLDRGPGLAGLSEMSEFRRPCQSNPFAPRPSSILSRNLSAGTTRSSERRAPGPSDQAERLGHEWESAGECNSQWADSLFLPPPAISGDPGATERMRENRAAIWTTVRRATRRKRDEEGNAGQRTPARGEPDRHP
jgi:hypothetical protein